MFLTVLTVGMMSILVSSGGVTRAAYVWSIVAYILFNCLRHTTRYTNQKKLLNIIDQVYDNDTSHLYKTYTTVSHILFLIRRHVIGVARCVIC